MRPSFPLSILLASVLGLTALGADDAARLLQTVQSNDTSDVDRANAFEKLGDVAGEEAVAPLVGFLGNQKWSHYARFALQKMEGENVTNALLQSLDGLEGDLKLGVIDTIGRRGDSIAVPRLTKLLAHDDAKVAAAAAVALGTIGSPDSAKTLAESLDAEKDDHRRESLASSLLLAGQRLAKQGNAQAAIDILDRLRNAEVPKPYRIGATQNALLARGEQGVDLLVEQLISPDQDFFLMGLAVGRALPGKPATQAIAQLLAKEPSPDRQVLLILALKDRGDRQALDAVLEKLNSDSPAVKLAAIDAIGTLGDDSSVPILLSVANAADEDAVLGSLVALKGTRVNAALMEAAEAPNPSTASIKALGRRRASEAVPLLLRLSAGDSELISQQAIVAVGLAASQDRFLDLFELLKTAKNADRKAAIQDAIRAAVFRSTQPDACAEALGGMIPSSSGADREFLFEQIRTAGGTKAINLMRRFALGSDESLQDAATETLGRWLSADAAPVLLQVAQADGKFANRALGGYIRIFRQFELPDDERVAMAAQALKVATRSTERNAAIDAMTRFPCVGTFELALNQLDVAGSKEHAAEAALTIGRTVLDLDPERGRAGLKRLIDANVSQRATDSAKALLE
jgi:HEAT repeat protein